MTDRHGTPRAPCTPSPTVPGSSSWRSSRCGPRLRGTSAGTTAWTTPAPTAGPPSRSWSRAGTPSCGDAAGAGPLGIEDGVTLDLIGVVVTRLRQAHELRLWEMEAIDQYGGPQALVGELARLQRVDTPERLERLLDPAGGLPGLDGGAPRQRRGRPGGRAHGRGAGRGPLHHPDAAHGRDPGRATRPSSLANAAPGEDARERPRDAVERHVRPAHAAWLAMLERYAPRGPAPATASAICPMARRSTATTSWPGRRWPRTRVAIHEYGLARLAELEAEAAAHRRASSGTLTSRSLRAFARREPGQPRDASRRSSSTAAEELIARAEAEAPRWFGRLPRDGCDVRAGRAPHGAGGAAGVLRAAQRGRRRERASTSSTPATPASRPLHRLPATTFHEAVPGHHFQIAIEQELTDLPTFRRFGSRLAGGAYVEGWALYAERLAHEMGLYRSPARALRGPRVARRWRAARLVVDTGIHASGWTRQQSIDLLRERAGLSQLEAETETDRYISWPGQALSLHDRPARDPGACARSWSGATATASTSEPSTTRSSATARCRSRRCAPDCRAGWHPAPAEPAAPPGRQRGPEDFRTVRPPAPRGHAPRRSISPALL